MLYLPVAGGRLAYSGLWQISLIRFSSSALTWLGDTSLIASGRRSQGECCQRRQVRKLMLTSWQATASRAPDSVASLIHIMNCFRSSSDISRPGRFPRSSPLAFFAESVWLPCKYPGKKLPVVTTVYYRLGFTGDADRYDVKIVSWIIQRDIRSYSEWLVWVHEKNIRDYAKFIFCIIWVN